MFPQPSRLPLVLRIPSSGVPGTGHRAEQQPVFCDRAEPCGHAAQAIATGDFNGDGFPDMAVANCEADTVSILLGTGDGNFQPPVNNTVGQCPTALATEKIQSRRPS